MRHMEIARAELGVHEVAGAKANPRIMEYYRTCGATWPEDDAVPWCGAFMGFVATKAGASLPAEPLRAKSWATWGEPLKAFEPGCIVITSRGKDPASGHVTLGESMAGGKIRGLGGNQGDEVSIVGIDPTTVIAYRRFPGAEPAPSLVKSQTIRNATYAGGGLAGLASDGVVETAKGTVESIKGVFGTDTTMSWFLEQAKGELKWLFLSVGVACLCGVIVRRVHDQEKRA